MEVPDGYGGGFGRGGNNDPPKKAGATMFGTDDNRGAMVLGVDEADGTTGGTFSTGFLRIEIPYPKGNPPTSSVGEIMGHVVAEVLQVRDDINIRAMKSTAIMKQFRPFQTAAMVEEYFTYEKTTYNHREQYTVIMCITWDDNLDSPMQAIKQSSTLYHYLQEMTIYIYPHRLMPRSVSAIGLVFCKHPSLTNPILFDIEVNEKLVAFIKNHPEYSARLHSLWDGVTNLIETNKRTILFNIASDDNNYQQVHVDFLEWRCARGTGNVIIDALAELNLDERHFGGFKIHVRRNSGNQADEDEMQETVKVQMQYLATFERINISGIPHSLKNDIMPNTGGKTLMEVFQECTFEDSEQFLFTDINLGQQSTGTWTVHTTGEMKNAATQALRIITDQIKNWDLYQTFMSQNSSFKPLLVHTSNAQSGQKLSQRNENIRQRFKNSLPIINQQSSHTSQPSLSWPNQNKKQRNMLIVDTKQFPALQPKHHPISNVNHHYPSKNSNHTKSVRTTINPNNLSITNMHPTHHETFLQAASFHQTNICNDRDEFTSSNPNKRQNLTSPSLLRHQSMIQSPQSNNHDDIGEMFARLLRDQFADGDSNDGSRSASTASSFVTAIASVVQEQVDKSIRQQQQKFDQSERRRDKQIEAMQTVQQENTRNQEATRAYVEDGFAKSFAMQQEILRRLCPENATSIIEQTVIQSERTPHRNHTSNRPNTNRPNTNQIQDRQRTQTSVLEASLNWDDDSQEEMNDEDDQDDSDIMPTTLSPYPEDPRDLSGQGL